MTEIIFGWDNNGISNLKSKISNGIVPDRVIIVDSYEFRYIDYVAGEIDGITVIASILEQFNIPLVLITGTPATNPVLLDLSLPIFKNLHIVHWDNFWLTNTFSEHIFFKDQNLKISGIDIINNIIPNKCQYQYKYINLNYKPHNHRCLLIDLLAKYNLISSGAISWNDTLYNHEKSEGFSRGYNYKYWKPRIMRLDVNPSEVFRQEILPKEYSQAWMQIVSETTEEMFFLTEKTSIPLFCKKPFLVAASKGFHNQLKKMGFVLYDEIFDYSFDNISDTEHRYTLLVQNLQKICSLSNTELTNINQLISSKLEYNRNRAIELATDIKHQPAIISEIYEITKNRNTPHAMMFNQLYENLHNYCSHRLEA